MPEIILLPTDQLIATEHVKMRRVARIKAKIERDGLWTRPICVEQEDLFVMDGHHRLKAAQKIGLSHVPVLCLDYESVRVRSCNARITVTPDILKERARRGLIYPFKTTRHDFRWQRISCAIPLSQLTGLPQRLASPIPVTDLRNAYACL